MDNEEEILNSYIKGTENGGDNRLRATVGSLSSKRFKELSDTLSSLRATISNSVFNLMANNVSNTDKLNKGIDDQVRNLNKGIESQVDNLISSNERLGKSNEKNFEQTHKFTRVNVVLTFVIAFTGLIGLWNIYLTNEIKNETIRSNQISEQPFLNFIDVEKEPYRFVNSGKGVALNFALILWDKNSGQLYVNSEETVGQAAGIGMVGRIDNKSLIKIDLEGAKKKIPVLAKLYEIAAQEDTSWIALVYEDIYSKKFATIIRGPGGKYNESVQFVGLGY